MLTRGNNRVEPWLSLACVLLVSCSTLDFEGLGAGTGTPDASALSETAFIDERTVPLDAGLLGASDAESEGIPALERYEAGECTGQEDTLRDRDCDGEPDVCLVQGACDGSRLVVQLLFEGDLQDASGMGNDARAHENVGYTAGAVGEALALNWDTRVELERSSSLDFLGEVSIEMWVQALELPAAGRAGLLDDDGRFGLFVMANGQISCTVADVGTALGGLLEPGVATHLACVADGQGLHLVQDSQVVAEVDGLASLMDSGTQPLVLGGNAPSGDRFRGWIDTLRIWNMALSPEHLQRAAATGRPR